MIFLISSYQFLHSLGVPCVSWMEPKSATWTFPSKLHDILDLWDLGLQHMLENARGQLGRWEVNRLCRAPSPSSSAVQFPSRTTKYLNGTAVPFRDWNVPPFAPFRRLLHAVRRTQIRPARAWGFSWMAGARYKGTKGSAKLLGNISGQLLQVQQ